MITPPVEPVPDEPAAVPQPSDRLTWVLTIAGIVAMLLACVALILVASFR